MRQRLTLGSGQPRRGDKLVAAMDNPRAVQRPGLVVRPREPVVPGTGRAEQHPPRGEDMVALTQLAGAETAAHLDPHPAGHRPRARPQALAAVGDLPAALGQPHP